MRVSFSLRCITSFCCPLYPPTPCFHLSQQAYVPAYAKWLSDGKPAGPAADAITDMDAQLPEGTIVLFRCAACGLHFCFRLATASLHAFLRVRKRG